MLILQQYTTDSCAVCRAHKPVLAELEREFSGELKVEIINVNSLPQEEALAITTVPFYRLLRADGSIAELWCGTKGKEQIVSIIETELEDG